MFKSEKLVQKNIRCTLRKVIWQFVTWHRFVFKILLRFGPTILESDWNRCAAISGRARIKV